ncbi:MAG: hypothetical protein MJB14_05775, partial [Spirochaetes bacterium]|nr:hypothetical protein [Spirochaetota bacterium]
RNDWENQQIKKKKKKGFLYMTSDVTFGPDILLYGNEFTQDEIDFAAELFCRYSKTKGNSPSTFKIGDQVVQKDSIKVENIEKKIAQYLVV